MVGWSKDHFRRLSVRLAPHPLPALPWIILEVLGQVSPGFVMVRAAVPIQNTIVPQAYVRVVRVGQGKWDDSRILLKYRPHTQIVVWRPSICISSVFLFFIHG
jgi:hypothetical protein